MLEFVQCVIMSLLGFLYIREIVVLICKCIMFWAQAKYGSGKKVEK